MTRILVLTTTYPHHEGDGTPRFVSDLARSLSSAYELRILTPRVPDSTPSDVVGNLSIRRFAYAPERFEGLANGAIVANLRAQPWRLIELPLLSIAMWRSMRREVRDFDPDVIHAHWTIPTGLIATLLPKSLRRPVLITSHGVDLHAFAFEPLESIRRLALRRADCVTTVSQELADRVRSIAGLEDIPVIPMGADTSSLTSLPPSNRHPDRVLFVGRLAEKKGVSFLLDAIAQLSGVSLTIIGGGPLLDQLRRQAATAGIQDRVAFLGQQDRAQVMLAMRECSVLVIPSITASNGDREGTPVVLAEAIAQRTPIVATNVGGLAERLDDASAWMVPESDAEALARAISTSLNDPTEAARRAEHAFDRVLPELDLRHTASAYASIIDRLAATRET